DKKVLNTKDTYNFRDCLEIEEVWYHGCIGADAMSHKNNSCLFAPEKVL
ncbi:14097_t:CDS:1, partial [Acaulospora morrowiae]